MASRKVGNFVHASSSSGDSRGVKAGAMPLPTYGIFGPSRSLKDGLAFRELLKQDNKGAVFEFCTDDTDSISENMANEEKYFGTSESMKFSYLLNDVDEALDDDDGSISMFQKLGARMSNVTDDGGVKKLVLNEGVGGMIPEGAHIRANYHAFLEDMVEPFDSSYLQGRVLEVTLGTGSVIPGLDLALTSMRKKEKSRFLVAPQYAYGTMGCPPRIPPDVTILFEVEVISFMESSLLDGSNELSYEERGKIPFKKVLAIAVAEKNEGNELFRQDLYKKALQRFMKCINALEYTRLKNETEEAEMVKVASRAYQNMALCHLKLGNFGKALAAGRHVLEYLPENPKALYLVGKSLRHIGDFGEARRYMLRAHQSVPSSCDVIKELKLIDKIEERTHQAEVSMCKKMFNSCHLDDAVSNVDSAAKHRPTASPSFQRIMVDRLEAFRDDGGLKELAVPVSTFTQGEIYSTADAAEALGMQVEYIDKPGKPKSLKIMK